MELSLGNPLESNETKWLAELTGDSSANYSWFAESRLQPADFAGPEPEKGLDPVRRFLVLWSPYSGI